MITFSLLNTMLNSSAMVGLSIPALGTPERSQTIITLLDKVISANLLYLDALQKGVDQQPVYQQDIKRFEDAVWRACTVNKVLNGDASRSARKRFRNTSRARRRRRRDDGLTDDVRAAIEASLRNAEAEYPEELGCASRIYAKVSPWRSMTMSSIPDKDEERTDATYWHRIDGDDPRLPGARSR